MITNFISEKNIILNMKSKTKEKAFKEILSKASFHKDKQSIILCSLTQREALGTTGIGRGIAIPHARTLVLKKLKLFIGISKKGIEYDAMDGKPVHLIFLIIAPPLDEANQYLILLGQIAAISKHLSKSKKYFKITKSIDLINLIKETEEQLEDYL